MKPTEPENQKAQTQNVEVQQDELNEKELDAVGGGLSGTSMKVNQPKPNEKGIIAILIGL